MGLPAAARRAPRHRRVPRRRVPRRRSTASPAASSASTSSSSSPATSSPSCCCATSRGARAASASGASTRGGSGACSRPRSSCCSSTAVGVRGGRGAGRGRPRRSADQGRVPLRRQLVLHPRVERLLRRRHRRQPGPALLVAVGRGAVLPGLAAAARRAVRRHPAAPAERSWTSSGGHRRRRRVALAAGALVLVRHATSTGPTTAPTPGRTSCSPAPLLALTPGIVAPRPRAGSARAGSGARSRSLALRRARRRRSSTSGPITRGVARHGRHVRADRRARERPTAGRAAAAAVAGADRLPRPDLLRHVPLALADHRHRAASSTSSPVSLFALARAGRTGLASLSYQILERPVRESSPLDRYRVPVIAVGLALSVIGAFVLAPAVVDDRRVGARRGRPQGAEAARRPRSPADLDWQRGAATTAPARTLQRPPRTAPRRRRLPAHPADRGQPRRDAAARVRSSPSGGRDARGRDPEHCPWQDGPLLRARPRRPPARRTTPTFYDRVLPELDPDIVIVAGRTFDDPNDPLGYAGDPRVRVDAAFLPRQCRDATATSIKRSATAAARS